MRSVKLLLPFVTVCALVAFAITRLFAVSSATAPAVDRDHVAAAAAPAPAHPAIHAHAPSPPAATATDTAAPVPPASAPGTASGAARTRGAVEQRLRTSGAADPVWAGELGASMRAVLAAPEVQAAIRNAPTVECFAEGCIARLVFASASEFDLRQQELGESPALERWPRVITGPERQPDGSVENALIVFRPPSLDELAAIEERRLLLSGSR